MTTVDGITHTYCEGVERLSFKPHKSICVPDTVQFDSCRKSGVLVKAEDEDEDEDEATAGIAERKQARIASRTKRTSRSGNSDIFLR